MTHISLLEQIANADDLDRERKRKEDYVLDHPWFGTLVHWSGKWVIYLYSAPQPPRKFNGPLRGWLTRQDAIQEAYDLLRKYEQEETNGKTE